MAGGEDRNELRQWGWLGQGPKKEQDLEMGSGKECLSGSVRVGLWYSPEVGLVFTK